MWKGYGVTQSISSSFKNQGNKILSDFFAGDEALLPTEISTEENPGWFNPDDVIWRVNTDSSLLVGGLSSLLLQTLHPLVMAGVADHSDYREDPLGRLNRTGKYVAATTFGNEEIAQRMVDTVNSIHDKVFGKTPEGEDYSARTSHLLKWVHVTEVFCFLNAYQTYGPKKLDKDEMDLYVSQMSMVVKKLGVVDPPETYSDLLSDLENFKEECKSSFQSEEALKFLLTPSFLPLPAKPAYGLVSAAAISLLPLWVRKMLLIPLPPLVAPIVITPSAKHLIKTLRWFQISPSQRASEDV